MSDKSTIDATALERLSSTIGGDPEDLAELIEDFVSTTPALVAKMRAAAQAGDDKALGIAAHTLKANARDFGATALDALCAELELMAKDPAATVPLDLVEQVEVRLAEATAALRQVRAGGS